MEIDNNITLISGFYPNEGNHIWSGNRSFILVRNALFKTLIIHGSLGVKDANITIYECERKQYADYQIDKHSDEIQITVNLYSESTLLCIESDRCLQPNIEIENSTDYRRLGICFISMRLVEGDLYSLAGKMKIDIEQTKFHLDSYIKGGICDVDYYFLENFKDINIPGWILDIGANVGQSALSLATIHPTARILSYEPNQLLIPNLEIVKRVLHGRMKYVSAGAGTKSEQKSFYIPYIGDTFFTQEGSFYLEEVQSQECINRIKQDCRTEDRISIKKINFDIVALDNQGIDVSFFIKIDTQGAEQAAILGMQNLIEEFHPVILMEKGVDADEIVSILNGYKILYFDYGKNRLVQYDTHSANAFFVHKNLTNNDDINSALKYLCPVL